MKIQNLALVAIVFSGSSFAQSSSKFVPGLDYRCVRNAVSVLTGEEVKEVERAVRAVDPQGLNPTLQDAIKKMNEIITPQARDIRDPSKSRTDCFSE